MGSPRMRPVFVRPIGDPVTFQEALRRALASSAQPIRGATFHDVSMLRVREEERQFWSPVLHLSTERSTHGAWELRGRFSPSSPIWTAFVAIYLLLTCLALAAASWGCAQWMLGETPWALWGVLTAVLLAAFTAGASFIGQGLGAEDMHRLRCFVDEVADGREDGRVERRDMRVG